MNGASVTVGWGLALALVVLVAIAIVVSLLGRFGISRALAMASVRAVVQLAVVATIIVAVVRSWWLTVAFVLVMLTVASFTSARRMTRDRTGLLAAVAIGSGVVPVLAIVLLSGAVPLTGIAVVPVAGIVIGGAMTATSLGAAGLSTTSRRSATSTRAPSPSADAAATPP